MRRVYLRDLDARADRLNAGGLHSVTPENAEKNEQNEQRERKKTQKRSRVIYGLSKLLPNSG